MSNQLNVTPQLSEAFAALIDEARSISAEVEDEVTVMLEAGSAHPLTDEEAARLIERALRIIRDHSVLRGDTTTVDRLQGDLSQIARQIAGTRTVNNAAGRAAAGAPVKLMSYNGIQPRPVHPSPYFYGREIPMNCGFVRTRDIKLWPGNERLDVHVDQFNQAHGRKPTPEELLDIMASKLALPGISGKDQFEIAKLARSIAANGVQRQPIIDTDGTLLDGNRRVAACYYILNSDEFTSAQKARAEMVFVWQLTEHATEEDRHVVVVSLNFEEDFKVPWPEYVKARKVYEEWQTMLALEGRVPNTKRQAELKRELASHFALGNDTQTVNRYLKMVQWANEFEQYHVVDRQRDEFEVKHVASEKFQYFDELSKGTTVGGVAPTLTQNPKFRNVVFDLLLDGKFKNWNQIRDLPKIYASPDALQKLDEAAKASDVDDAQDLVDDAIAVVRMQSAGKRQLGANERIESFVTWLEELPVKAFRDSITPANLDALLRALRLVEGYAEAGVGSDEAVEDDLDD